MQGESNLMWASASFVGVLIVLGVPLWWKTTEVYRVALPYDKINGYDSESHYITTELTVLANDEKTAAYVAKRIKKEFDQFDVIKLKITAQVMPDKLHNALDSVVEEQLAVDKVCNGFDINKRNSFYVVQRKLLSQDVWVGRDRVAFFRDANAVPTLVHALKEWIYQPSVLAGARSEVPDAARQMRFPSEPGFDVVLSVVNPKPHLMKVDFNVEEEADDYIGFFLDEIAELHNFTLKTQWIQFLDFDFEPIERDGVWWVQSDRLPQLLTRLEARAATRVSGRAAINLALYVAPCNVAPLVIHDNPKETRVQALMTPKWGGVVIGNPSKEDCELKTYKPDLKLLMGTFIIQLRKLLGITEKEKVPGAHMDCLHTVSLRAWELDALLRIRALEQVTSAERSLKSLAKLLGQISNIVINDEVGDSIAQAVFSIESAARLLRRAALPAALAAARAAAAAADTAFMHPSLLALLYFPDDQKYAIYIPLFLPIMLPVVLSLKKLVLWLRKKPEDEEKEETTKEKSD